MSYQKTLKIHLTRIALCGMLCALAIVFCRLLGFPTTGIWRMEISFLPIVIVALFYGPIWSSITYGIADLIGAAIFTGINPFITLEKVLMGLLFGLFFHNKKKIGVPRILISMSICAVVLDFFMMSLIFHYAFGYTFEVAFAQRGINAAVNLVVRSALLILSDLYIFPHLFALEKKHWTSFHSYANSFQYHSHMGLDEMRIMLEELGHPERDLQCIHVGGTNGKGSVVTYLDRILREAGYKVGKYMSPNLVSLVERISINGKWIEEEELNRILNRLEPLCKKVEKQTGTMPSQFEIWTAAAFVYFKEQHCDYVVLEVGMGGEFDATNVITHPVVSILTKIALDHMAYLGNTVAEIAKTKCGIFKEDSVLRTIISAPQEESAWRVITEEAQKRGLETFEVTPPAPSEFEDFKEHFEYRGAFFETGIPGVHQIENACIAIETAYRMNIPMEVIQKGILLAWHPARFEILSKDPLIIYDGGHNPNGISVLKASLDRYLGKDTPRTYIFACMKDKDIGPSLQLLKESPCKFLFTTVTGNPRAMAPDALQIKAQELGVEGLAMETLADALKEAQAPVVICGSLYLYEDVPEDLRFGRRMGKGTQNA